MMESLTNDVYDEALKIIEEVSLEYHFYRSRKRDRTSKVVITC